MLQNEMQISLRNRLLGEPTGDTLLGKTVFILGYGNIGIELAKRLKPFGSRVIATKRFWPASIVDSDCMGSLLTPLFALTNHPEV
jgi:phosphoglycerate dehydrogenase-like enzyme